MNSTEKKKYLLRYIFAQRISSVRDSKKASQGVSLSFKALDEAIDIFHLWY